VATGSGGGVDANMQLAAGDEGDAVIRLPAPGAPAAQLVATLGELAARAAARRRPGLALELGGAPFLAQERALAALVEGILGRSALN
jgi:hypothetical protein